MHIVLAISNALQLDKQEELKTKLRSIIADNPKSMWPRIILARKLVVEKHYLEANSAFRNIKKL